LKPDIWRFEQPQHGGVLFGESCKELNQRERMSNLDQKPTLAQLSASVKGGH
jgi:hypothetical protein